MGLPVAGGHATNLVALNRMALTSKSAEISNAARAPDMKPLISSIGEPNSATRKKFAVGGDSRPRMPFEQGRCAPSHLQILTMMSGMNDSCHRSISLSQTSQ
jgi:hypothetical protein